jgi:hypothetical protein
MGWCGSGDASAVRSVGDPWGICWGGAGDISVAAGGWFGCDVKFSGDVAGEGSGVTGGVGGACEGCVGFIVLMPIINYHDTRETG